MKLLCIAVVAALVNACSAELITGKVIQVVESGLLVSVENTKYNVLLERNVTERVKTIFLVGHPQHKTMVDNDSVWIEAEPFGRYQYEAVSGGMRTIERYRVPPPPPPPTEAELFEQRKKQLAKEIQEAEARQAAADKAAVERVSTQARIIAYQLAQASNGFPSFQVELGKRYARGDGVETNYVLARHWLQSACTNGSTEASNLLHQLQPSVVSR